MKTKQFYFISAISTFYAILIFFSLHSLWKINFGSGHYETRTEFETTLNNMGPIISILFILSCAYSSRQFYLQERYLMSALIGMVPIFSILFFLAIPSLVSG